MFPCSGVLGTRRSRTVSQRHDYFLGLPLHELPTGGLDHHAAKLAGKFQGVALLGQIDRLPEEVATESEAAEPFAGFLLGVLCAYSLMCAVSIG